MTKYGSVSETENDDIEVQLGDFLRPYSLFSTKHLLIVNHLSQWQGVSKSTVSVIIPETAGPCVPVGRARLDGAWLLSVKGGKIAVHAV
jgi:hypothetical protein